jgi:aspartyl-tRNA(Asn)/glutamyl-tRNA(Gln) amidotransferase subunit C
MAVTLDDVKHVAGLARLSLTEDAAGELVAQLNGILSHMDVLAKVDTSNVAPVVGIDVGGTPLRPDSGTPVPLAAPLDTIAPEMRDGFFLVPRLATHETAGGGA